MATTTNLLSWEAFEQLPDDGMRHEIFEGEPITLPPQTAGNSEMARRIYDELQTLEDHKLGRVFWGAGYKLSEDPATWIQPDISFVPEEQVRATSPDDYFIGAPELAVEIASPSETARDLDRKVDALLAGGAIAVWVIFPETRRVRIYSRDGISCSRGINDKLSMPELLPDFEIPVAKLFED